MIQETAINWLRKKLEEAHDKEGRLPIAYTFSLLNKAEQMEKEHIIETFDNGVYVGTYAVDKDAEEYYNETYGGQGSPDTTTSPNTQNK